MDCHCVYILNCLGDSFAEGWMRADDAGKLGTGQTVDNGGGKFCHDVGRAGTHQLCAEDDIGFLVSKHLDEAALLLVDERASVAGHQEFAFFHRDALLLCFVLGDADRGNLRVGVDAAGNITQVNRRFCPAMVWTAQMPCALAICASWILEVTSPMA